MQSQQGAMVILGLVRLHPAISENVSIPKQLDNHYYVVRYYVMRNISDPTILILASLAEGDKHGYAMMMDIRTFANVKLGPGTLYGAITRLEQRGFIRPVAGVDRRQPYRLTAAGRRYLEQELAGLDSVVRVGVRRLGQA